VANTLVGITEMKIKKLPFFALFASTIAVLGPMTDAHAGETTYDWSGFYAGVNGGYGFGNPTGDYLTIPNPGAPFVCFGPLPNPVCPKTPDLLGRLKGGVGGVQAAYLVQNGSVVWGGEASFQVGSLKAKDDGFLAAGVLDPGARLDYSVDYYATVAARIGMAFNRTQVFAAGGLAYGKGSVSISVPLAGYAASQDYSSVGWTAGAGVEYAVNDKISIGTRFDYVSLKPSNEAFNNVPSVPLPVTVPAGADFSTVRAVINFKF
jgi:outer membrane immunogenic protein